MGDKVEKPTEHGTQQDDAVMKAGNAGFRALGVNRRRETSAAVRRSKRWLSGAYRVEQPPPRCEQLPR